MNDCTEQVDLCIVRGDSFAFTIGLDGDFSQTVDDADLYRGRLVVREVQSDEAPELIAMETEIVPTSDPWYGDAVAVMHFTATAVQTQALPPFDLVCFCEIVGTDDLYARRLFRGRVKVED